MTLSDARQFALELPGSNEEPHHHMSSFRVAGKIFATVPDDDHLHVFVDDERREMALAMFPDAYEKLWWGKKVVGIKVHLDAADHDDVEDLLRCAWKRKSG